MKITLTPCEGATLRCAICHDDALDGAIVCAGCRTLCHPECRDDVGCPTLGCLQRTSRRWRVRVMDARPPRRDLVTSVLLTLVYALCLGFAGLIVLGQITLAVMDRANAPRVSRVRADMRAIGDALDLFKLDCGRYPQQFKSLWERPADLPGWRGPYLKEYPPCDPWFTEYVYVLTGANQYEILSLGADGAPGGTDDATDLSSRTINTAEAW